MGGGDVAIVTWCTEKHTLRTFRLRHTLFPKLFRFRREPTETLTPSVSMHLNGAGPMSPLRNPQIDRSSSTEIRGFPESHLPIPHDFFLPLGRTANFAASHELKKKVFVQHRRELTECPFQLSLLVGMTE